MKGKLIDLLESGDVHLLSKHSLREVVKEMIEGFPKYDFNDEDELYMYASNTQKWFDKYLSSGKGCKNCEYKGTMVCEECIAV